MNSLELDIVIVNWNSGRQLLDCLRSINKSQWRNNIKLKVIVVDNASEDESINLASQSGISFDLIKNKINVGFGRACNQGAKNGDSKYLLFLNPDVILFEDSLEKAIEFMSHRDNDHIGILGIQLLDEEFNIVKSCARFPTFWTIGTKIIGLDKLFPRIIKGHFMTEWNHQQSRVVNQVMGAFFLIKRYLFEKLGGFDPRFFLYFEEVDLSYRAKVIGFDSYYLSSAKAIHKGCGSSKNIKAMRLFYSLQSRIFYVYKHLDIVSASIITLGSITVELATRLLYKIITKNLDEIPAILVGYSKLYINMPIIFKNIIVKFRVSD